MPHLIGWGVGKLVTRAVFGVGVDIVADVDQIIVLLTLIPARGFVMSHDSCTLHGRQKGLQATQTLWSGVAARVADN